MNFICGLLYGRDNNDHLTEQWHLVVAPRRQTQAQRAGDYYLMRLNAGTLKYDLRSARKINLTLTPLTDEEKSWLDKEVNK